MAWERRGHSIPLSSAGSAFPMSAMVKITRSRCGLPVNIKSGEFTKVFIYAVAGRTIQTPEFSVEKQNRNDFYKDELRSIEIKTRQMLNHGMKPQNKLWKHIPQQDAGYYTLRVAGLFNLPIPLRFAFE